MKTNIVFFLLLCFGQSCVPILPDEELTEMRTQYSGNELRIDGCFVCKMVDYYSYTFFYLNGVCISFGLQNELGSGSLITDIEKIRNYKGSWGVFHVENNTINLQTWKQSDVLTQFIVQKRFYKIINDTTLSVDLLNNGYIKYYHFKRFMPKPDSTNVFIK